MRRLPLFLWVTVVWQSIPPAAYADQHTVCHSKYFDLARGEAEDDYLIYGLTQDCQLFFIRPSQLSLLSTLHVNLHNSYCYPNLVQIHVQSHNSLLILLKQAGDRICTLEVQIPQPDMLFGDHVFSYSLLASIPFSACSTYPRTGFSLETDLSYMDSVYKDVIYFIDGRAEGALWNVHQFLITEEGYMRQLETLSINHHSIRQWTGPDLSSEYVVGLDAQRNYLYKRSRFEQNYLYECSFDLMFRPSSVVVHYANTTDNNRRTWLNSLSADEHLLIYAETDRTISPPVTRIYSQNVSTEDRPPHCIATTPYALDIGVIRTATLSKMERKPLPSFSEKVKAPTESQSKLQFPPTGSGFKLQTSTSKTTTVRVRKTTLKATKLLSTTTDGAVTSTRFEYEDDQEESDAQTTNVDKQTTNPPPNVKVLSTDANNKDGVLKPISSEETDIILQNITDAANYNGTKGSVGNNFVTAITTCVLYHVL